MNVFLALRRLTLLAAALALVASATWAAGGPDSATSDPSKTKKGSGSVKEDIKSIGPAFRQAGHETKDNAKKAGHGVKKGFQDAKEDLKHPTKAKGSGKKNTSQATP